MKSAIGIITVSHSCPGCRLGGYSNLHEFVKGGGEYAMSRIVTSCHHCGAEYMVITPVTVRDLAREVRDEGTIEA